MNIPKDALPRSRCKGENSELWENNDGENTDASHAATKVNLGWNVSTLRKLHHESTIFRFRCVEIRVQCCDSSKDLEERTTIECLAAILRLRERHLKLSAFIASSGLVVPSRNNSRLDLLRSLENFCNSSNSKVR